MQRSRVFLAIISFVLVASAVAGAQTSEWAWMSGSQAAGATGVYGTLGDTSISNVPGARRNAFTWTDSSGNLWLFGGYGKDSSGDAGELNDLWVYNPTTYLWTWMGGSKTANAPAVYGGLGASSTTYIPGSRDSGVAWTDKDGNLWLFGGNGYDSAGKLGYLSDLWEYSPTSQQWVWVSGSKTANSSGSYISMGTPSTSEFPSAREGEDAGGVLPGWTDAEGNLWLFGGHGEDSTGTVGSLNDLWEFTPASGAWTWISGSKTANSTGLYGVEGVADFASNPSARESPQAWKDSSGNFWLHGGYAPNVTCSTSTQYMCVDSPEMWEFNPLSHEWTWFGGWYATDSSPVYGSKGVASATSNPSGREMAATWVDAGGNLWLFSGYAFDGQLDDAPADLWMYNTTTNQWTWEGGNTGNVAAVYGTLRIPSATNWPEAEGIEGAAATWVDAQGNFWLFSGAGNPNDMWVYHASPAATPTFSVSGGTYTTAQTVTISDTTPGAAIYYTTNGTTPTASSSVYSTPLAVSSNQTIEAIAIASGYPTSAVATETYAFVAATTTTVTTSLNPATANYNQVPFTVTVSNTGSTKPTGSVVLWIGSVNIGSATLDSTGKASFTVGTESSSPDNLNVGQNQVAAVYGGDSNNAGSTSAVFNEVVQQDSTATVAATKVNPASLNSSVTFTATVMLADSGPSSIAPSGTVTFKDGSSVLGTGTVTASGGGSTGSAAYMTVAFSTSSLGVGSHSITAVYGGDSMDAASTSVALSEVVNLITPTVTVTPSASSITTTQSLAVTVSLNGGTGNPTPTGSVTLTGGSYTSAATALSGGSASITIPANTLSANSYTFKATYTPDAGSTSTYNSATGTSGSVTVSKATPAVTVTPAAFSITTAQSLSVTVAVSGGTGSPTTTGSVTLTSGSYTSASTALSGGSATVTVPAGSLSVGSDTLTASYTPDASSSSTYNAATGTSSAVTVTAATPTFSASNSGAITVEQGATTGNTSTITVTPSNGFTGTVTLSCSVTTAPASAMSPVTCGIPSSVSITGAGVQTATLTANSTTTTTTGAYAITVTATSGSITQTTVVNVTVNSAPGFTTGSGGSTTLTVSPGSTTGNAGTISVAGTNGFSGTVALSCSVTTAMTGVNDMPTCSLNPTSVTISGTTAQSSTLTVNTTAATSAVNHMQQFLWPSAGGTALAFAMFFVTPRRRRNWLTYLGAFVLLAFIGATGCGGGSNVGGGGTSNPGTTAGTYTVTVTGTGTSSGSSGSVSATVGTVTLTVN